MIKNFLYNYSKFFFKSLICSILIFSHFSWAGNTLPLPRFASLRSNEVNLRVGPGSEYPLEWVFRYEKMPIEIIQEFGPWRKIRDFEGAEGWAHQSMLSGRRMVLITGSKVILHKDCHETSKSMAYLQLHTLGKLLECQNQWCRIQIDKYKGWVLRHQLWGVYANENKF